jgi:hypothetical protein
VTPTFGEQAYNSVTGKNNVKCCQLPSDSASGIDRLRPHGAINDYRLTGA